MGHTDAVNMKGDASSLFMKIQKRLFIPTKMQIIYY